jgi:hypothetical protein
VNTSAAYPERAVQDALAHLFPELPPWLLRPLMGAPYEPLCADNALRGTTTDHPASAPLPHRALHLHIGTRWVDSVHDTPLTRSALQSLSCAVEGFEVALDSSRDQQRLHITFRHRIDRTQGTIAPFGAAFVSCDPRAPGAIWRNITHSFTRTEPPSPTGQATLLRRWAALPDPRDRTLVQGFWIGHPEPVLAQLGLATLQPIPQRMP